MKRILLVFAVLTTTIANAQKGLTENPTVFSLGLEGSVPVGEFHSPEGYNFGFGGSAQVSHKVASAVSLTLYAGYLNYPNQRTLIGSSSSNKYHLSVIPLLAGVKLWFSPKAYAQGQLGAAFNTIKYSNSTGTLGKSTSFAYSPGVGFVLAPNVDFVIKYFGNKFPNTSTSNGGTMGSFGVRLAYNFLHRK